MILEIYLLSLLGIALLLMAATRTALVNQMVTVDNVALATLAARTALTINSTLASVTSPFLVKRVRYLVKLHSVAVDEGPFIVGLANGDASDSEISTALNENNSAGPEDTTQSLSQDNSWVIWWNTTEFLVPSDSGGEHLSSGQWHSLGKGL